MSNRKLEQVGIKCLTTQTTIDTLLANVQISCANQCTCLHTCT